MANIVNFDDVKESKYISTEGKYTVKVVKYERTVSNAGNDMDVYDLETKDKESIKLRLSLNEKAMFRYKMFIKAIRGLSSSNSVGAVDLDSFPREALGKKVVIDVVRAKDTINIETGLKEPSKFMEIRGISAVDFE